MADVADVARFLEAHPPFTGLGEEQLASIAATVQEHAFAEGETALVEDGTPASVFYVIATGSMELVHEEEVIDILEPGEAFGHPSLLTGLAPAFTVRAHEDTLCYMLGREAALAALARPAGVDFVAQSMRERLTRTGHTVHALPGLGTVRLPELVNREPLFCEPETTIREAAAEMTAHGSSAILVPAGERLSIVTDADLRARVVAGDVSRDDAVSRIAGDAVRVGPDHLAVDAVVDMLELGVEHLVVEDRHGVVLGIVSAATLTSSSSSRARRAAWRRANGLEVSKPIMSAADTIPSTTPWRSSTTRCSTPDSSMSTTASTARWSGPTRTASPAIRETASSRETSPATTRARRSASVTIESRSPAATRIAEEPCAVISAAASRIVVSGSQKSGLRLTSSGSRTVPSPGSAWTV